MAVNTHKIEFFDREEEAGEIISILESEPRLINFIYGPINSGKTTLTSNLIESLPPEYVIFYVNLRGKFISDYEDFIRAMFRIEKNRDLINAREDLNKAKFQITEAASAAYPSLNGFWDVERVIKPMVFVIQFPDPDSGKLVKNY